MTKAIGSRREDICDSRIHVGLITRVERKRSRPHQHWKELVVGDDLHLRPDDGASHFINLVAGKLVIGFSNDACPLIVLTEEQRMQRRQRRLLVNPEVTGKE